MSLKLALLGSPSSHGGVVISASPTVTSSGTGVARVGDLHSCPQKGHGVTPITTGSSIVMVDGKPVARVTSMAGCGAIITSSASVGEAL